MVKLAIIGEISEFSVDRKASIAKRLSKVRTRVDLQGKGTG